MKSKNIMIAFLAMCFTACSQHEKMPYDFYKIFTGKVNNQLVVLQLQRSGNRIIASAEQLENSNYFPLYYISDSSHSDTLFFSEGLDDNFQPKGFPVWKVYVENGHLIGKRFSADRKKSSSIALEENYPDGTQQFQYFGLDTIAYLIPGDTSKPFIELQKSVPMAMGNTAKSDWLNLKIKNLLDFTITETMPKNMTTWANNQITKYQELSKGLDTPLSPTWMWVIYSHTDVFYNRNNYVVLSSNGYQFSGGAHGGSWELYQCLDLKNKKELQLKDIVSADSTILSDLLEQQFRKDYHLKPADSLNRYLFDNVLMPNDNFSFTDNGLTFTYNQYEVAAYAVGIIRLTIPWKDLKLYIAPEFAERMHLKANL